MPGGMGQVLQLLSTLSEIQDRRRRLDLEERQLEAGKQQFASSIQLNERDQKWKEISKLLDTIGATSTEGRSALTQLGTSLGLDPASVQALANYGLNAPETLQTMQQKAAAAGQQQLQGTPQGQQVQREAYTGAVTGMNQGQVAQSGTAQQVFGQPLDQYGKDFLGYVRQGAALHMAGQAADPFTAAVNAMAQQTPGATQTAMNQNVLGMPTPVQAANIDINRGQLQLGFANLNQNAINAAADNALRQLQIQATMAGNGGDQASLLNARVNALTEMRHAAEDAMKPGADKTAKYLFMAQYNALARASGWPPINNESDIPGAAGFLGRVFNRMGPSVPGSGGRYPRVPR